MKASYKFMRYTHIMVFYVLEKRYNWPVMDLPLEAFFP